CQRLAVAVAHGIKDDRAGPGGAAGNDQRVEWRLWSLAAAIDEISGISGIGAVETCGETSVWIFDVKPQRQDGTVAGAAVGDRERHCQDFKAPRRLYGGIIGGVAPIGDDARRVNIEISLLERCLPQAV